MWTLPNRETHQSLCIQQTLTYAKLLHCCCCLSRTDAIVDLIQLSTRIAIRIISTHSKIILNQLSSNNLSLVHSTLSLLLTFCRISTNVCQTVYLKLISPHASNFASLLQSKQTSNHSCSSCHSSVVIDSKQLMTMIFLLVLESCGTEEGPDVLNELLPSSQGTGGSEISILKKLLLTVHNHSPQQLQLLLSGILYILETQILDQHLHILLDSTIIQRLLGISTRGSQEGLDTDHQIKSDLTQQFFLELSHRLVHKISNLKRPPAGNQLQSAAYNSLNGVSAAIIRHLSADTISEHKQAKTIFFKIFSSFLQPFFVYSRLNRFYWKGFHPF